MIRFYITRNKTVDVFTLKVEITIFCGVKYFREFTKKKKKKKFVGYSVTSHNNMDFYSTSRCSNYSRKELKTRRYSLPPSKLSVSIFLSASQFRSTLLWICIYSSKRIGKNDYEERASFVPENDDSARAWKRYKNTRSSEGKRMRERSTRGSSR